MTKTLAAVARSKSKSCGCQVLEEKQWEAAEQWMWSAAEKPPLSFNVASSCLIGRQLLADLHHSSNSQPKQTPDN